MPLCHCLLVAYICHSCKEKMDIFAPVLLSTDLTVCACRLKRYIYIRCVTG